MLRIKASALQKIIAQAERDYPYETCGLLLGKAYEDVRIAFGAYETPNANKDRKHDRYEIDPKDYMKAEEKAKQFGLEIVGVYHSHPDHPDRPSQTDEERAFEGFSYIIVSVSKGKVVSYRSWELKDGKFVEEPIDIFG
ncbi:Mov34/MPN/PAD-1 family protein [Thermocrinis minervae]|uniref:Proteasome lid subunit RPN8/RPN11, contains Jab1/MPN metalloenzyme (JAMM) motif n=1 Tax=Thermocrinis minervae TaxID=381751 RepID=A0A1M6SH76_9AQUI|nr:M67 family metallopeptidase [Thermocrinis minervae]SHK44114.1 Proteasome lid subunit RPN8/RPN11, contains Jab1/MPN metalloenzyme (JAMM) motif [Thermocrinis minervae]